MTRFLDGVAITAIAAVDTGRGEGWLFVATSDGRIFRGANSPLYPEWEEIPSPLIEAPAREPSRAMPDTLTLGMLICAEIDGFVSVGPIIYIDRARGYLMASLIVNDEPAATFVFRFKDGSGHAPSGPVEFAALKDDDGRVPLTSHPASDGGPYTAADHPRYVGRLGGVIPVGAADLALLGLSDDEAAASYERERDIIDNHRTPD